MRTVAAPFGSQPSDAVVEEAEAVLELDRTLAVLDGGRMVGGAAASRPKCAAA